MRRIIMLVCCLMWLFSNYVFASEGGVLGDAISEMSEEEKPGIFEKSIAKIIIDPANWILKVLGMTDPVILVFGKNPSQDDSGFLQGNCTGQYECADGLVLGVFESGLIDAIDALYSTFERFTPFPLVIALLLIAFFLLLRGTSVEARSRAKDYIAAFLIGVVALRFGYYLWVFSANVVQAFIDIIWAAMMDKGITPALFLEMFWGTQEAYTKNMSVKSLGLAALVLIAAVMAIAINYQYMVRKIILMVLLVLFPVTCILTVYPKFRHSMQTWWDEFLSNIVLPAAHALALGLFFLMMHYSSSVSIWIIIVYMFALPTIAVLVRKLVGVQDSVGGVWGAMSSLVGLAGLMSLTKMLRPRGGKSGKNGATMTDDASIGGSPVGSSAMTAGGEVSATGPSGATSMSSSGSGMRAFATKAVSYGGKAVGYGLRFTGVAAGGAIGYTAGVMAGNSGMAVAGAMLGGQIGRKTADWTGRGMILAGKGAVWAGKKTAPVVNRFSQAVDRRPANVLFQAPEKIEATPETSSEIPTSIHFPAGYKSAGEDFWQNVDLNNRYKREYIVELVNSRRLQRHNDLEQTILKRNPDYYV